MNFGEVWMKNSLGYIYIQERGTGIGILQWTVNADKYPVTKLRSFDAFAKKRKKKSEKTVACTLARKRGGNIVRSRTSLIEARETFLLPREIYNFYFIPH